MRLKAELLSWEDCVSAAACVPQESRPPQKLLQTGMTRVRKEGGEGEGAGGQTLTAGCAHVILGAELLHQEQGCSPPPSLPVFLPLTLLPLSLACSLARALSRALFLRYTHAHARTRAAYARSWRTHCNRNAVFSSCCRLVARAFAPGGWRGGNGRAGGGRPGMVAAIDR